VGALNKLSSFHNLNTPGRVQSRSIEAAEAIAKKLLSWTVKVKMESGNIMLVEQSRRISATEIKIKIFKG